MKEGINERLQIPENVEVKVEDGMVYVKGKMGESYRRFAYSKIKISKGDKYIELSTAKADKNLKKILYTFKAHIKNMIYGVKEGYQYKLKICYSHFPINVEVKDNLVLIKNFLGEKIPRKAKLIDGVKAKVEGSEIILEGYDRESIGQSAANIEIACKIKDRDRRVFQDGIWLFAR